MGRERNSHFYAGDAVGALSALYRSRAGSPGVEHRCKSDCRESGAGVSDIEIYAGNLEADHTDYFFFFICIYYSCQAVTGVVAAGDDDSCIWRYGVLADSSLAMQIGTGHRSFGYRVKCDWVQGK